MPVFDTYTLIYSATIGLVSGVARLGHTGAHALATRGCAQPVHVRIRTTGADSIVVDCELSCKRS